MNLNFSDFKTVATANEKTGNRTPLGQKFDFKFKKFNSNKGVKNGAEPTIDSNFVISNSKFDEMGLSEYGLMEIISPDGIPFLAVVSNDDAVMMKRTGKLADDAEKGKKFKSTKVEDSLHAQGIIDKDAVGVTQKLTLTKVADATEIGDKKIAAQSVWAISKAEETEEDRAEQEREDANENTVSEESVESQEQVIQDDTTIPEATASETDDDNF